MRNFLRRGCRLVKSVGAGLGGLLGARLFVLDGSDADAAVEIESAATHAAFTALHLARIDPSVSQLSFGGTEPEIGAGANAVLLAEGYEAKTFRPGLAELWKRLEETGLAKGAADFTTYRLAFSLLAEERSHVPPLRKGGR